MKSENIINKINLDKDYYSILSNREINKKNDYVLYWMQGSQRLSDNRALSVSAKVANQLNKKIIYYL